MEKNPVKSPLEIVDELRERFVPTLSRLLRSAEANGAADMLGARALANVVREAADVFAQLARDNAALHELLDDAESRVAYLRRRLTGDHAASDSLPARGVDAAKLYEKLHAAEVARLAPDVPRERPMRPALDGEPAE